MGKDYILSLSLSLDLLLASTGALYVSMRHRGH